MPHDKTAIVTGLRGQDGSYLAEQLIDRGYLVYGLIRRSSQGLDLGCAKEDPMLEVVEGDLLDPSGLVNLCNLAKPDLFFNMAAQSHVGSSFKQPTYTTQVNAIGTLNCLEAIRLSGIHTRFLQASTSEMYGGVSASKMNEDSVFYPRSPYGCAKLYSYWITKNYRESYKMFACSSICFNHESERRGSNFVTRKISLAAARIKLGLQDKLYLGNLEAKRDWGYAPDFTRGMIMMLVDAPEARDYVLSTGETHSVREFCEAAFSHLGLDYRDYVEIDPRFYRPAEVDVLIGDSSKIQAELGWKPTIHFNHLVHRMVDYDMHTLQEGK
jgi:GDPmannose 4,6-dehydratase